MAHFARLDSDNVVLEVLVVSNDALGNLPFPESEPVGVEFMRSLFPGTNWKQTSYNASFRGCYAGIGYTYNAESDEFIPPEIVEQT